jgi:hypothetical protein
MEKKSDPEKFEITKFTSEQLLGTGTFTVP